ncbi:hypothetical protein GCM10010295_04520 [Streptomyces intermedius]
MSQVRTVLTRRAAAAARALVGIAADCEIGVRVVLRQIGMDGGLFGTPGEAGGVQALGHNQAVPTDADHAAEDDPLLRPARRDQPVRRPDHRLRLGRGPAFAATATARSSRKNP